MKKKLFCLVLAVAMLLSGCCLSHEWQEATCETPKTCAKCEKVEGEALGHNWQEATCETAKTCSVCAKTEGDPLGHQVFWSIQEEEMAGICEVCQQDFQEELDWDKLGPCHIQGTWEAYSAPEGTSLVVNADGTAEFNRGDKTIAMTWEYLYADEGLLGESAVFNFASEEITFDAVVVGMLRDIIMFPVDGTLWNMIKK